MEWPNTHNTDFAVPDCAASSDTQPPPVSETTWQEQQGHHGVHTFSTVHNASGAGPDIAPAQTVAVSCKVLDGTISSVNPDGYWYRIASSPWNDGYYAPANTFMNGDPWTGPYAHNTDIGVPDCGSGGVGGGSSQPVFTVMNTSESPPDGVWFRNSPHTADTDKVTGHGVYMNEQVRLKCYAIGDAVGSYANRLWYNVDNVTRPTNNAVANSGYLNAHYINDGKAANVVDAGVPAC